MGLYLESKFLTKINDRYYSNNIFFPFLNLQILEKIHFKYRIY